MTTKRDDESQTEFTDRLVRAEAQRELLSELRAFCTARAVTTPVVKELG